MAIDTRIDGTPDAVHGIADWVAHAVAPRIQECAESLYANRNSADAGWDGPASDVFVERVTTAATEVDAFTDAVNSCASRLRDAAAALAAAHTEMAAARTAARTAGLLVMADSIAEPILDDLRPAFRTAEQGVALAREYERQYAQELKDVVDGLTSKWFFVGAGMIVSGAFAATKMYATTLAAKADFLFERADEHLASARNAGPGTPARLVYQDWDMGYQLNTTATALSETAKNIHGRTSHLGARIGGVLSLGELVYDIYSGTPALQAVASGGAGMGASVLAGTAAGTLVAGPIGTAVGAGVGVVAGIYTSGVVDGLFEDGLMNPGDRLYDGIEAIEDTGKAIADLTAGVWRAAF